MFLWIILLGRTLCKPNEFKEVRHNVIEQEGTKTIMIYISLMVTFLLPTIV